MRTRVLLVLLLLDFAFAQLWTVNSGSIFPVLLEMRTRVLLVGLLLDGAFGQLWTVNSGASYCTLSSNGACITDGVGSYGNSESCIATANAAITRAARERTVKVATKDEEEAVE